MSIYIKGNDFPERSKISKVCLDINMYLNNDVQNFDSILPKGFYYSFGNLLADYVSENIPKNIWGISIFSDQSLPDHKIYQIKSGFTVYDINFVSTVNFIQLFKVVELMGEDGFNSQETIVVVEDFYDIKTLDDMLNTSEKDESVMIMTNIAKNFGGIEFKNVKSYKDNGVSTRFEKLISAIYTDTGIVFNMSLLSHVKSIYPLVTKYKEANYELTDSRQLIMKKSCIDNIPLTYQYIIGCRGDKDKEIRTPGVLYTIEIKPECFITPCEADTQKLYKDKIIYLRDIQDIEVFTRKYNLNIDMREIDKKSYIPYIMRNRIKDIFGGYEIRECEGVIWNLNILKNLKEVKSNSALKPREIVRDNTSLYSKYRKSIYNPNKDYKFLEMYVNTEEIKMRNKKLSSKFDEKINLNKQRERVSSVGENSCTIL